MKTISLLLALCFSMNVFASTGTIQELETALDNYTYAVTVEWDQKDQDFYQTESKIFEAEIKRLMDAGLSVDDMLKVAEKKLGNKELIQALKHEISLGTDLDTILKNYQNHFYSRGASWDSDDWAILGQVAMVVTFVVLVVKYGVLRS